MFIGAPLKEYKDAIVVKMTGGIGNQLFGLAAGLNQARRLSCRLVLDARAFGATEIRSFELGDLGYEVIQPTLSQARIPSKFQFPKRAKSFEGLQVFKEAGFDYDDSNDPLLRRFTPPRYFSSFANSCPGFIVTRIILKTCQ